MLVFNIYDKETQDLIKRILQKSSDLSSVTKEIEGIIYNSVRKNFEQEGRPKWHPLSPATIKERRRKGFWPGKMLQRNDSLLSSISSRSDASSAEVSTDKPYARVLHFGGRAGRGRKASIPPRPFLKLTKEDESDIRAILKKFLDSL